MKGFDMRNILLGATIWGVAMLVALYFEHDGVVFIEIGTAVLFVLTVAGLVKNAIKKGE